MFEKTNYICVHIRTAEALHDGLMAWLSDAGYEAFEQEGELLKAFIPEQNYQKAAIASILSNMHIDEHAVQKERIEARNWNADWEATYASVEIDDFCQIVPSFHQPKTGFTHTIYLDPKMSFGTGHHQTTRLMIRQMKEVDFNHKRVLDMGCGTAVLGILASKMGAASVLGIDIDPWSAENGLENAARNQVVMPIVLGDATAIPGEPFDIILANINRGVLLQDAGAYKQALKKGGTLLISGFLTSDLERIRDSFKEYHFEPGTLIQEKDWLSLELRSK
jgi:ribosomal protein L11 methyltransferase